MLPFLDEHEVREHLQWDALIAAMEGRDAELTKWAKDNGVHPASYAMKGAQILGDIRDRRAEAALTKQLSFSNSDPRIQAATRAPGRVGAGWVISASLAFQVYVPARRASTGSSDAARRDG